MKRTFVILLMIALAAAGCVESTPDDGANADAGDQDHSQDAGHDETQQNDGDDQQTEEKGTIKIGIPGGWVGEELRSHMVAYMLKEELGYNVETIGDLEAGPIYQSIATGDLHVFVGSWLPLQQTHFDSQPEGSLDIIGQNLPSDGVSLNLAVPQYLYDDGITSIADLQENPEMFDETITGIEAGAGMMITAEERMKDHNVYNLGDWTLQASSTAAMLAAYDDAVQNEEPIVVTTWKPHYMYAKWEGDQKMVDLADPGFETESGETMYFYQDQTEAATINTLVPADFREEFPGAVSFLENFQYPVEDENNLMLRLAEDDSLTAQELAVEYIENNPDVVDSWLE